jgi:hypothetical protein
MARRRLLEALTGRDPSHSHRPHHPPLTPTPPATTDKHKECAYIRQTRCSSLAKEMLGKGLHSALSKLWEGVDGRDDMA